MQNPRFGSKTKIAKNMLKSILQMIYSCSVKKPLQKTPNIREIRAFSKSAIMQRLYSPCKILTLGQKLKFQKICQNPFCKSFTVVVCKKALQKTPNIQEVRAFSKSAIMQSL